MDFRREGKLSGLKVKGILVRSRLDFDTLAKVWDLCDVRKLGYMDQHSFILALYLIDQRLRGFGVPRHL